MFYCLNWIHFYCAFCCFIRMKEQQIKNIYDIVLFFIIFLLSSVSATNSIPSHHAYMQDCVWCVYLKLLSPIFITKLFFWPGLWSHLLSSQLTFYFTCYEIFIQALFYLMSGFIINWHFHPNQEWPSTTLTQSSWSPLPSSINSPQPTCLKDCNWSVLILRHGFCNDHWIIPKIKTHSYQCFLQCHSIKKMNHSFLFAFTLQS